MGEFKPPFLRTEFNQRIKWLINLRWIASFGLFIVVLVSKYILHINLPVVTLFISNAILIFYNSLFLFFHKKLEQQTDDQFWFKTANYGVNLQISLDLILLLLLIHFSGGLENPFIFFFIFHMVIASILLSRRAAYFQATAIIFLYGLLFGIETMGLLDHYHLSGFIPDEYCIQNDKYFVINFVVFSVTLYIIVYMSTTIIQKLRERENDLKIANDSLKEQDRLKSLYVFTISHDIKGSLAAIQSCLKVVLDGLTGAISKKSKDLVGRAERRSEFLLYFVDDLLKLSEVRAAREMIREDIIISELIKKVVDQLFGQLEEKNLLLTTEYSVHDVSISANRELISEVFINLITNAVKYTPAGGKIILKMEELTETQSIRVILSDTGIGVPEKDLAHIFEDFYRAGNAKKYEKNGTGLGLSFVKQIVELHGGTITVESKEGEGSSFIFTLPVSANVEKTESVR